MNPLELFAAKARRPRPNERTMAQPRRLLPGRFAVTAFM
jgi:hypothetical protein